MNNKQVPLSESVLWKNQEDFFQAEGIEAWNRQVPFYITSNPYMANAYAMVIMRFMQDYRTRHSRDTAPPGTPFYILELGSGPGQLAYYLVKRLLELKTSFPGFPGDFVYVMSDVSEKNLRFWASHPALKPLLEAGVLDFAHYRGGESPGLEPRVSAKTLGTGPGGLRGKPLVVIANYVFDAVATDVFRVKDGKLQEGLVRASLSLPEETPADGFFNLEAEAAALTFRDIESPYYAHPTMDKLLSGYKDLLDDGSFFLFPVGALRCLEKIRETLSDNLLLLTADKGTTVPVKTETQKLLKFQIHGKSVSSMLNFHLLELLARESGGDCRHHPHDILNISAFSFGFTLSPFPETELALSQFIGTFNASNIGSFYYHFNQTKLQVTFESVVMLLELTSWDPEIFNTFVDVLIEGLPRASQTMTGKLLDHAGTIAENFYYLPGAINTMSNLGVLLQHTDRYAEALRCYLLSVDYYGKKDHILYNIGLCYYHLADYQKAVEMFREALSLNPNYIKARGWIAQMEYENRLSSGNDSCSFASGGQGAFLKNRPLDP